MLFEDYPACCTRVAGANVVYGDAESRISLASVRARPATAARKGLGAAGHHTGCFNRG